MLARSHAIGLLALTGAVFGLAGCQSTPADISENSTRGSSTNPVSLVQKLKPKRLVIIGDSHSAAPNSWTDSIDCVPVFRALMSGSKGCRPDSLQAMWSSSLSGRTMSAAGASPI